MYFAPSFKIQDFSSNFTKLTHFLFLSSFIFYVFLSFFSPSSPTSFGGSRRSVLIDFFFSPSFSSVKYNKTKHSWARLLDNESAREQKTGEIDRKRRLRECKRMKSQEWEQRPIHVREIVVWWFHPNVTLAKGRKNSNSKSMTIFIFSPALGHPSAGPKI